MRVITVNVGSNSLRLDLVAISDDGPAEVLDAEHTGSAPTAPESLRVFDSFLSQHCHSTDVIVHRCVHGGDSLRQPQLVDPAVLDALRAVEPLDPQHVPATLQLVERTQHAMPSMDQVLCPDTGFHRTLPAEARVEPLPERWRSKVRRYGFHGLSYAHALRRTSELLDRQPGELNLVLAHLGGGCSVCAVSSGESVDTTMGLTPLGGITMSKRTGDLDPGLLLWLIRNADEDVDGIENALREESGLLGLSDGKSGDTRELVRLSADGDVSARMALRVFARRAAAGIASMATNLSSLDALVFTGEIGWNQPEVRQDVCARLSTMGITAQLTGNRNEDGPVSGAGVEPPVLVVEPREELQLASEAVEAMKARRS